MKIKLQHLLLFLLLLGSQSACKKIFEQIPQPQPEPKNDYSQCRVKKITGIWDAGILHAEYFLLYKGTLVFTYNTAGNPVSIGVQDSIVPANDLPSDEDITQLARFFPYKLFRYDGQNRLTDLIEPKNPSLSLDSGYRRWHRYGYNGSGQIIADTLYEAGTEVNGRPSSTNFAVTNVVYDAQGRVLPQSGFFTLYNGGNSYDSLGNLDIGDWGTYPYDTTLVNPLRTNNIWMFLGMNYSKNAISISTNPSTPDSPEFLKPNGCKLPTYYNNYQPGYYPVSYTNTILTKFFDLSWIEIKNIEYECSCNCDSTSAKVIP